MKSITREEMEAICAKCSCKTDCGSELDEYCAMEEEREA
jgi:hypothetical protein